MRRSLERTALAGTLVLALVLRVVGNGFGLDLADPRKSQLGSHIDERGMVEAVQDHFLHGSLDPGSFLNRGQATFLLFGLVDAGLIGAQAVGHPGGWHGRMAELDANPSWLHLVHRWLSALAGVGAVFVLARMLRREFDPASGLLAGLFLAVAYLHVRDSHFGTVDALFSLTILLALDWMLRWIREPSAGCAAKSGLMAGVSAATKYFSALLGLHLVLAHFLARKGGTSAGGYRLLLKALLAGGLVFLLLSPGFFVAGDEFARIADWTGENYTTSGKPGALLGSLRFHFTYSLGIGLGEPAFLLALWGMLVAWRRGKNGRFLVLSLLLLLPTLVATSALPVRYGIPVLTLLAGFAGIGAAALCARTGPVVGTALVVLCAAPSLARSVSLDHLLMQRDTRSEMLAELERRGVPAEDVLAIGWHNGLPIPAKSGRASRPYLTYGPKIAGRPERTLAAVRAKPPRLILWDLTAPEEVVPERAELEQFVHERYREVLRLDGRKGATELPYAISPALMFPYSSPWEMSRPGSALVLYERLEASRS